MLITTRPLLCFGKKVEAFQPIPHPEKWDKVALHACLSIGAVKEVSDSESKRLKIQVAPPEPHVPEKKKKPKPETVLHCNCGREFKSPRGLTIHRNRTHHS